MNAMPHIHVLAETAALVGEPARTRMLDVLMDGRALTASELARAAGITAQTASGHLAQLTAAGLLAMERQGRHRYHRLASPAVADMLERLMAVATARQQVGRTAQPAATGAARPPITGPRDQALRHLRTCYGHLAGRVAVAMADRLVERGHVTLAPDGGALTPAGADFLRGLGIGLDAGRGGPVFCRPCLDWSERRHHIAGRVGTAMCTGFLAQGWLRRLEGSRALAITPTGRATLGKAFGVDLVAGD